LWHKAVLGKPSVILMVYLILSLALGLFLLVTVVFIRILWADSEAVEIDLLYVEKRLQEKVISESVDATV
ncbi:MAG: hypothetical protein KJP05_01590, partial [Deltaproteobacteria bacterium]|nr:hypothetical protein [Deltaproteobacteria bacterium]